MPELTIPFDYRNILIGEEIAFRALSQQERHAQQGTYGREWTDADRLEKSAMFFKANVLRSDFAIPSEYQHCFPEPPCPWEKQEDKVDAATIKPVIFGADGVYTYALGVYQRIDGNNQYTIGNKIIEFVSAQNALDSSIRNEYAYFATNELSSAYQGAAIFVIERFHKGNSDREFHYTFDLLR